jgi:hypothetical protein
MSIDLNKFLAGSYIIPHQDTKDFVGGFGFFDMDLLEHAFGGIHGGHPELFGIHFSQAFVALESSFAVLEFS